MLFAMQHESNEEECASVPEKMRELSAQCAARMCSVTFLPQMEIRNIEDRF